MIHASLRLRNLAFQKRVLHWQAYGEQTFKSTFGKVEHISIISASLDNQAISSSSYLFLTLQYSCDI